MLTARQLTLLAASVVPILARAQGAPPADVDPQLARLIATIPAIDNHAHPVLPPPNLATDRGFDALPVDSMEPQTDPVAWRPDNPALGEAWKAFWRFSDAPPPLKMEGASDSTATAWIRMRNLVFSLARGRADLAGAADDWSCLLNDVPSAAVGVLYKFHHAALTNSGRKDTAHWRLIKAYPAETCKLLEWGLRHRDKLWASRTAPPVDLSRYVIRMLGEVGDAASARLLRSYVADTEVGRDAVSAVRRIEERWEAPVSR